MKSFIKNIVDPVFPTKEEKNKELWDVKGRLKRGNQLFKFDIRPLKIVNDNRLEKIGYFNTKADKIVFEDVNQWIIFDTQELNEYIKSKEKRDFNLKELLNNLNWNIVLLKK